MNDRIKTLRNKMAGLNIEGMIISNPINIKYLTGIDAEGIFLVTRKENIYITDGRYIEYVSSILTPFDEIVVDDFRNISTDEYENFFMFCENVGFEENYVTYADYKEYMHKYKINNFVEAECIMNQLRMLKDDEEIANIKKACRITDKCFEFLLEYIKPGMTEKHIAKKIEEYFNENAEGISFDTIVASGENSSKPHAIPGDRKIEDQDIITIDMGCKINGYCSDMTRTIFVGLQTPEQKRVYDLVLKNQRNVLNQICDGANIKNITKSVTSDFEVNGYDLIHSLGHGVGLEIHEKPFINLKNENLLKEDMIITDEPGIYIPGNFGIRIEDTVLVTKQGSLVLTESKKDSIIIKV
ncbi:MAG: aminopeptidase P family protein [Clostridia bacterium]|nr:aminopeptidase P family protein [Clostridia bacterium]